ncbi:phosphate ABC transporter permease subunit PstC [Sediminicurvatus halobius]|uniref:Phosphate transport system permease protein n=1 Tax=Sediminicurvatus halobius TaxID=2182432 RepID=A0A2U2N7G6_9GAMM|nr:phosphate ABC transporter permease subunit PstC [Spiribacter halobius]PWG65121.1 phosphate ABC transporter permease subunit PstC [Spiribacter halobius]UEX78930.1 phosphate ABC transporter permease subunit PstC [Spiribacter halobius]
MGVGETILLLLGGLIPLGYAAYYLGRRKALVATAEGIRMHSRPQQYGWYSVVSMALPAMGVAIAASLLNLLGVVTPPREIVLLMALVTAAVGLAVGLRVIRPSLRARNILDNLIRWLLLGAALISIITTIAIVLSVIFEAMRFFREVSVWEFVTGTVWSPGDSFLEAAGRGDEVTEGSSSFGSVPLFAGTFMVTAIAMAVALPIGLLSAIFMSEYASPRIRGTAKPLLEILAGIPTVVYGFFAAITVTPVVVDIASFFGLDASYSNILSPGIVMGIMIIPFISSLSDDVINSIPQSLREGAYALGTTRSETIRQVVLPAALPGVISAFLLGVSRALGETMIVVMAAGVRPNLTWNPLEDMTTVTVNIVYSLTGDQAFDSPQTLSAFALGLVLFLVTLALNLVSTILVRRFKQRYD